MVRIIDLAPWSPANADLIDIAEQYALGQNDNRVLARDFDPSFHDATIVGSTMGHLTKQFPFILEIMQRLPENLTILLNSAMASYVKLQRVSSFKNCSSHLY